MPADPLAGRLARVVTQRAAGPTDPLAYEPAARATSMLQRWPAERVTAHPMSVERIKGKDEPTKRGIFNTMRTSNTADAHKVIEDLDPNDVWGSSKSDITGTGNDYSVRIDRQNPTPTHSNVQIQTNGTSVSVATVLVDDKLANAKAGTLKHHLRAAFKASLVDGMQWEVYDR